MIFFHSLVACDKVHCEDSPLLSAFRCPQEDKIYPIAVIGSGGAGTMAVKRAVLNNIEVIHFQGARQEQRHSRGYWVRTVDNTPGLEKYSRTIVELYADMLLNLAESPLSQNLSLVESSVASIEKEGDFFKLQDMEGHSYYARHVVLATGVMNVQPHIQGSIRHVLPYAIGQTIGYCVLCDGHRSFEKNVAVIGHDKAAALTAFKVIGMYEPASVTILTNGHSSEFKEDDIEKLKDLNVSILETPILEVFGDKDAGQLAGFLLEDDSLVQAEMGFIVLGIIPNNTLALQLGAEVDERGLVLTNGLGESSVSNLFVAGDLRAKGNMQIYTAWQHAVDSVQEINYRIHAKK